MGTTCEHPAKSPNGRGCRREDGKPPLLPGLELFFSSAAVRPAPSQRVIWPSHWLGRDDSPGTMCIPGPGERRVCVDSDQTRAISGDELLNVGSLPGSNSRYGVSVSQSRSRRHDEDLLNSLDGVKAEANVINI
jgi:hypothetical protein